MTKRTLDDAWNECAAALGERSGQITALEPWEPGWSVRAEISRNTVIIQYRQYGDTPADALDALRALITE